MDSMRTLNTSLPRASPPKMQTAEQPEQLLQAFKTAALSVTNLYKSAAQDHSRARAEGYQDALDDLLSYLDKEDIGISDGEGWQIRRWATERLDGRETNVRAQESDDEAEQTDRASSPVVQRNETTSDATTRTASPSSTESSSSAPAPIPVVPTIPEPTPTATIAPPSAAIFNFTTPYIYPTQDSEMETEPEVAERRESAVTTLRSSNNSSRSRNRHNGRPVPRSVNSLRNAAGQKRKAINLEDYWNIDDLGPYGKDGSGGGAKRSRFS